MLYNLLLQIVVKHQEIFFKRRHSVEWQPPAFRKSVLHSKQSLNIYRGWGQVPVQWDLSWTRLNIPRWGWGVWGWVPVQWCPSWGNLKSKFERVFGSGVWDWGLCIMGVGPGPWKEKGWGRACAETHSPVNRMTDITENITFLLLHWWAVKINCIGMAGTNLSLFVVDIFIFA